MIVYGDRAEEACPADRLREVDGRLRRAETLPPGIARHHQLVAALIALGEVAQGVADSDWAVAGMDGESSCERALQPALLAIAGAVIASWDSGFADLEPLPAIPVSIELPAQIEIRQPEGYALYAVYPEAYALAARQLILQAPPRVIGIRSIGTGLAAIAATAIGTSSIISVRPAGHPFARRIDVAPSVAAEWTQGDFHHVIVDEGPGLSGSSFAAVARWLEAQGIPRDRIACLPSHPGAPGERAAESTRQFWAVTQRPVVDFDELVPPHKMALWGAVLFGHVEAAPVDLSGGAWRAHRYADEAGWPAVNPHQERRKFLLRGDGARWLMKFAGLGDAGERKLARGRILSAAGLVPEMRGLVHGFTVERWEEEARPVTQDSAALLPAVAHYLAARARLLPPPAAVGASLSALYEMAVFNIGAGVAEAAAKRFAAASAGFAALESCVRPFATDGRMDRHEWLELPDGRILKADALDHDSSHDLIGPQDLAWDIAGAFVELELTSSERLDLLTMIEDGCGPQVDPALLEFLLPCYLAFRLGAARLTEWSLAGWPDEAARNRAAGDRYRDRLLTIFDAG